MDRFLRWALINGLFVLGIYYGLHLGVEGAKNVVMVAAWLNIFLSFFVLADPCVDILAKKGRIVPRWGNVGFDLLVACAFAWFGYTITAVFWLIQLAMQEAAFDKAESRKEELANAQR